MTPDLTDWGRTWKAVQAYARILGTVRRTLAEPLPHWWHAGLRVTATGISTGPLPGGWELSLDFTRHETVLTGLAGEEETAPLGTGPVSDMEAEVTAWLRARDLGGGVAPSADETPPYDAAAAAAGHSAQRAAADLFAAMAADIYPWEVSPILLWPHHFDVSIAVFGTRLVSHAEGPSPSQIGCGFSPPDDNVPEPYFYASPWPFPEDLAAMELAPPAHWTAVGFEGAVLPYSAAGSWDGAAAFFAAVYEMGAPLTLV